MEVTIDTERCGLTLGITKDIKRLSPRHLIPHNVERQLAMRVHADSGPMLAQGDLVIHRDTTKAEVDSVCEVVLADGDRIDLYDFGSDETYECIGFPGDMIVFDTAVPDPDDDADLEPVGERTD